MTTIDQSGRDRTACGDRPVQILKNGVEVDGTLGPVDTNSRSRIALTSAPMAAFEGDHFECRVWHNASGSLDIEADPNTGFALRPSSSLLPRYHGQAHRR